jgi:glycine cleavage system H protein
MPRPADWPRSTPAASVNWCAEQAFSLVTVADYAGPMNVPADLRYTGDHEWVVVAGDTVRLGITDYAQDALGDVVFVQLPAVGAAVSAGQSFGEVESTKSVSDIYAPVTGTVVAVNERLSDAPETLNSDPYGEGWICEIRLDDPAQLENLLDPDAYRALTGE